MKLYYFVLLIILYSCKASNEKVEKPNNLIELNKFSIILEELMMVEHQIQTDIPYMEYSKKTFARSSSLLFKKYHVSFKTFDESFKYYAADALTMEKIYQNIQTNMSKKLLKIQNKNKDTLDIKNIEENIKNQ
jgi:hypothetical protein